MGRDVLENKVSRQKTLSSGSYLRGGQDSKMEKPLAWVTYKYNMDTISNFIILGKLKIIHKNVHLKS